MTRRQQIFDNTRQADSSTEQIRYETRERWSVEDHLAWSVTVLTLLQFWIHITNRVKSFYFCTRCITYDRKTTNHQTLPKRSYYLVGSLQFIFGFSTYDIFFSKQKSVTKRAGSLGIWVARNITRTRKLVFRLLWAKGQRCCLNRLNSARVFNRFCYFSRFVT